MSELKPITFLANGPEGVGVPQDEPIDPNALESGQPVQHNHVFFADETKQLTAGVWTCTPMVTKQAPYDVNEFMLVLEGSITIEDVDGHDETIRAGEAFIIPKGMVNRWKQTEFVRKFYVIFDDPSGATVEDPSALRIVRVDTKAPRPEIGEQDESRYLNGTPHQHMLNLFSDASKQMNVGLWDTTDMHTKSVPFPRNELMHLLEGTVTLKYDDGAGQTYTAGDTFMVPKGMNYQWDSEGFVSKIFCIFQPH